MKNLYRALAAFQQEVPVLHKATQGFGYSYTDLPTILRAVNPLLAKHGLGFYQAVNGTKLFTQVFHVDSGERISASAEIPQNVQLKGMNDFQVLGSAITYLRRYQLSAMLGLVTDKDIDAAGTQLHPTGNENLSFPSSSTSSSARSQSRTSSKLEVSSDDQFDIDPTDINFEGKPELKPNTEGWKKAIAYILKAGKLSDIKKSFYISRANERELLKSVNLNK